MYGQDKECSVQFCGVSFGVAQLSTNWLLFLKSLVDCVKKARMLSTSFAALFRNSELCYRSNQIYAIFRISCHRFNLLNLMSDYLHFKFTIIFSESRTLFSIYYTTNRLLIGALSLTSDNCHWIQKFGYETENNIQNLNKIWTAYAFAQSNHSNHDKKRI